MKKYTLNIFVIGLLFLFSCAKKDKIAPDGTQVRGPVEFETPFAVSKTNPNFFTGDKVSFTAQFKTETYWVIRITGNTSGAVKTFEGTGTIISVIWDGTADSLPSFRWETTVAQLSFPKASSVVNASPLSFNITIPFKGTKDLNHGHVLITDFNKPKFAGAGANPVTSWPSDFVATAAYNDIPHINPDTNQYCIMGPYGAWQDNKDFVGHKSPYVDFLGISASSVGYPTYFPLISDPNNIYFNIMVYNNSLPCNTWLQITLSEEHPTIADSIIGKSINIYPNWNTGWKLITKSYLDFKFSDTTKILRNPQKIKAVTLVLLSNAPQAVLDAGTNPVSATFDHLIFTHYKPYQP